MTKIQRSEFVRSFEGKSLNIAEARNKPELAGLNLAAADLDHDGVIKAGAEADRLFSEVDKFDTDGSYSSVERNLPTGVPTKGGRMLDVLASQLRADGPGPVGPNAPGPKTVVKAAEDIIAKHGQHYGVDSAWFNLDPNHALPAGVELGGLKGRWKCNLFACNTVYAAGFEPPYYNNRGKGEYPNANQLYKWSDKNAAQFGNKVHFKLVGELEPGGVGDAAAGVRDLIKQAQPGDLIIVQHQGSGVVDGGHCRVLVGGDWKDGEGSIKCAQASFNSALARDETVGSFTSEAHVWILRPNRPRADYKPQPV